MSDGPPDMPHRANKKIFLERFWSLRLARARRYQQNRCQRDKLAA
jgi:hypothetical protein